MQCSMKSIVFANILTVEQDKQDLFRFCECMHGLKNAQSWGVRLKIEELADKRKCQVNMQKD